MRVLGIETSCDETAAAVVEDGRVILSNVVVSQIDIHKAYGGVVPEVAARSHIEAIIPVIDEAVENWDEIDAIAVANSPGLMGSLLIGNLTAKTLALVKNKPLYAVNHIIAHVYANALMGGEEFAEPFEVSSSRSKVNGDRRTAGSPPAGHGDAVRPGSLDRVADAEKVFGNSSLTFPMLALIISGGHTQIALFSDHGDFEIVGSTRDDAVGEAFDKVAKILGLPYPGGPSIAQAAERGDPNKYDLPKPKLDNPFNFSFSGLKTAVLRAVQADCGKDFTFPSNSLSGLLNASQQQNFAASFQKTACEILCDKLELAIEKYQPKSVVLSGGVAANQELRRQMALRFPIFNIHFPIPSLCTDNAAMVASLGYFTSLKTQPTNPHKLEVTPTS